VEDGNPLDRLITERIEHLNAARGWPWQQLGVESVGLDDEGVVRRYLGTGDGLLDLGPAQL
jgi:hypothetical protein